MIADGASKTYAPPDFFTGEAGKTCEPANQTSDRAKISAGMLDRVRLREIVGVSKWNYVTSRVLGAWQRPERNKPQVIQVKCSKCKRRLEARESNSGRPGTFLGTLGGMHITSACGAEETVSNSEVPS